MQMLCVAANSGLPEPHVRASELPPVGAVPLRGIDLKCARVLEREERQSYLRAVVGGANKAPQIIYGPIALRLKTFGELRVIVRVIHVAAAPHGTTVFVLAWYRRENARRKQDWYVFLRVKVHAAIHYHAPNGIRLRSVRIWPGWNGTKNDVSCLGCRQPIEVWRLDVELG
jgi:hypothetical protein